MGPTPEAARATSRAAYVFLYPLVVNYGLAHEMAIDRSSAPAGFGRWRLLGCADESRGLVYLT